MTALHGSHPQSHAFLVARSPCQALAARPVPRSGPDPASCRAKASPEAVDSPLPPAPPAPPATTCPPESGTAASTDASAKRWPRPAVQSRQPEAKMRAHANGESECSGSWLPFLGILLRTPLRLTQAPHNQPHSQPDQQNRPAELKDPPGEPIELVQQDQQAQSNQNHRSNRLAPPPVHWRNRRNTRPGIGRRNMRTLIGRLVRS